MSDSNYSTVPCTTKGMMHRRVSLNKDLLPSTATQNTDSICQNNQHISASNSKHYIKGTKQ